MALRATPTARPPFPPHVQPPSSVSPSTTIHTTNFIISKPQSKPNSLLLSATTALPLFAPFGAPLEARSLTLPKEQIVSSIDKAQVESTIEKVVEVGSNVFSVTGQAIGAVVKAVKPGVDATLPILKQAGEEAVKIASPVVSEASKKAQEAIESTGINTEPVKAAAKAIADAAQQTTQVIFKAKPVAVSTAETVLSAEPRFILGTGGALLLAYLLLPPIFSAISFRYRGYQGELTPAQTLDLLSTKNYNLIDIRSEKDKSKDGTPRLPSNAKNKLISIPLEDLPSKLKGLVKSVKNVEAELVALKISHLKKISKSSNIVIMDSYTDSSKIVAKALTNLGFNNCWIMNGGFSGGNGWLQSRLGADTTSFTAEVISPSKVNNTQTRRFGTSSLGKLLPGGSD
ncbi:calcium sensing receptor, chloroplastic [Dorcoceras hygrometricum]|uniref:Calcium sensing receptor, chloroplastic n=1 Tax=Dorcoceras hygrometricum TaxID=472368 RepID=A0A2Z7A4I8_9LAMI|nr:calcium sensing receptor, chloroplastic [Dorcoceras hygrometricum]